MTFRTESRIRIVGSVHEVYAYLCDVGRWPEWAPTVLEGWVRGGGPLEPGSRVEQRAKGILGTSRRRSQGVTVVEAPHHLPSAENGLPLQLVHARVHVPRGGDGECLFERRVGVVILEDVVQGGRHFFPMTHRSNHSTLRDIASSISFGSCIPWGWRG